MTKIDDIYDATDDFGLITSAEARVLGCSNAELVQYARRGRLERVGWGVYRIPVWPYQEASPYAAAVKSVGPDAYLYGESVVALLKLAPTNPGRMWVATPRRVRKNLGKGFHVVSATGSAKKTFCEGVPCQRVADAIVDSAGAIGRKRAAEAADEALRFGYINSDERDELKKRIEG
ncbi:type IV toxin-antitoxin system AbiEi family antitoxin domain-containing protein [Curtanaerobium respiraculi]|uniref:type IV toxin-antitoxin system AbiEi family antitoxin domain-containing protein n=1 Tax=Curtanaerobium respiraculi TaxID=2949669 RepID=UPI0024B38C16|nr:type IV toxin-antitoxin system AbiEi family antitoxin domain-containing protein [Curtanaerobium respiraculi]